MKKLFLFLTAVFCFTLAAQAQRTVTGTVVDSETDEPLIGATVLPLGGGTGAPTDIDGNFKLSVPANVKQIRVSYVGYETQTLPVASNMQIRLVPNNKLETVVVTGYGSGKKLGSVVGSVSVVGDEQFQNTPAANFVDALQGQVSGLAIFSASGDPSSTDTNIRLRGTNSIYAGNEPLFILDGAPVTSSVFSSLNPSDIESVTVLKDAASVAIYGSRAANGVIVISSKRGKFGEKAHVTVRAAVGWSQMVPDKIKMMDSKQYARFREMINDPLDDETLHVIGYMPQYNEQGERVLVNDPTGFNISTDWVDETFDGHAPLYSLEGVVQGGSDAQSYFISLGHFKSEGIICGSGMRRETLRVSLQSRVNDWFRIGFQSNLGYINYENNAASDGAYGNLLYIDNPMLFARKAMPYDSPRYYTVDPETGRPVFGATADYLHYSGQITPEYSNSLRMGRKKNLTINATLWEQLNPVKGLTLRAQQNVDAFDYRYTGGHVVSEAFTTPMGDYYDRGGTLTGANSQTAQRRYAWTYTNTAEYNISIADVHNITALLGQESIISKNEYISAAAGGFTDGRLMLLPQTPNQLSGGNLGQGITESVFNSWFFNASYDYDSKYFIEGTVRRDGSSKFAPKHRWSTFWSVGGMWNMKAENFLSPVTWLDELKFHISYGTTGNSSISDYMYFGSVGQGSIYNGQISLSPSNPRNEGLTWETVRSFDVGFNFGFLNIFSGEVDYYWKKTIDMLMPIPYSYTTGFAEGFGNVSDMRNQGIDLDIRADIIKTRDWNWALRANLNYNQNRITKLFSGLDQYTVPNTLTSYQVGHDSGELYMVRYAGVDPRDGKQMWYDKNGNLTKVFNEEEDAELTGKSCHAPWGGGFGTDLRWRDLTLKCDFMWSGSKYMINNDNYFTLNANQAAQMNQQTAMLNIWTTPGQITDIPKVGEDIQFDSHLLENASFIRLKNLTVQYSLPRNILNKMRLEGLSLHFTGRNLWTITNFSGYDPEPESSLVKFWYPNTRQYEFGLEVTF